MSGSLLAGGNTQTDDLIAINAFLNVSGVIGNPAQAIHLSLSGDTLVLTAQEQINGLSINLTSNLGRASVQLGLIPPGLALHNGNLAGGFLSQSYESSNSINYLLAQENFWASANTDNLVIKSYLNSTCIIKSLMNSLEGLTLLSQATYT
ncbi:MAG: hypothetical protein ACI9CF_000323 [Candidatus Omnitrophota bacterium]